MRILSILFLFLSSVCSAQSTAYLKIIDSTWIYDLKTVSTGGYISCGGDQSGNALIVRWNDAFDPVWEFRFDDIDHSSSRGRVIEASDGAFYYMTGVNVYLTLTELRAYTQVIKFSAAGTVLWQKIYKAANGQNLSARCIARGAGNDNGFILGAGDGLYNHQLIKCDASGNIEWQYEYAPGISAAGAIFSILPEADGYVAGGYSVTGAMLPCFTLKTNTTGALVIPAKPYRNYSQSLNLLTTHLAKLGNGYAALAATEASVENGGVVMFLDSNLEVTSSFIVSNADTSMVLENMIAAPDGNSVIVNGVSMIHSFISKGQALRLTPSGIIAWQRTEPGNQPVANGGGIGWHALTRNGNTIVCGGAGLSDGTVVALLDTLGNGLCGNEPATLVATPLPLVQQQSTPGASPTNAYADTSSYSSNTQVLYEKQVYCGNLPTVSVPETPAAGLFTVCPVPANEQLFISAGGSGRITVQAAGIDGRIMHSSTGFGTITVDTRNWTPGIYQLTLDAGKGRSRIRIMVQH